MKTIEQPAPAALSKLAALQAAAHLAKGDKNLYAKALKLLDRALESGIPSLKSRARKLAKELKP